MKDALIKINIQIAALAESLSGTPHSSLAARVAILKDLCAARASLVDSLVSSQDLY